MKDKLTLEDLAPYVPYGLKLYYAPKDEIINLRPSHFPNDWSVTLASKPILRNLSDLTKEIEHNGRKYCIMSLWFSVEADEEEAYELYRTIPDYWKTVIASIKSNGVKHQDYGFVKLLFKHHFDVNNLIERGLAVDLNTIKLKQHE